MSLPKCLPQLREDACWLQTIGQTSLRVGLPLMLATACLSCADPAGSRSTPGALQENDAAYLRSDALAPTDVVVSTNHDQQSSQPRDDYSDFAAGATATKDRFQLPDMAVKRSERAIPLVNHAP